MPFEIENLPEAIRSVKKTLRSALPNYSHVFREVEAEMRKRMETSNAIEGNKKKIEWGSQIRNYVLHPYKLVKDLRTDYETSNAQGVLDGDLNDFLKAYLMEFGGPKS